MEQTNDRIILHPHTQNIQMIKDAYDYDNLELTYDLPGKKDPGGLGPAMEKVELVTLLTVWKKKTRVGFKQIWQEKTSIGPAQTPAA